MTAKVRVTNLEFGANKPITVVGGSRARLAPGQSVETYIHDEMSLTAKHYDPTAEYDTVPAFEGMDFSTALLALNAGCRVARVGWNGKGMFIFKVNGSRFTVNREPLLSIMGEGTQVDYHAHVDMRTADGQIVPWLCSQTDMQAMDWVLIGPPLTPG